MQGKFEDLTGKRFERILVLERSNKQTKGNRIYYKCLCNPEFGGCGKIWDVAAGHLGTGTKSCGCLGRDNIGKRFINLVIEENYQ